MAVDRDHAPDGRKYFRKEATITRDSRRNRARTAIERDAPC